MTPGSPDHQRSPVEVAHVLKKYDIDEWGGIETHVAAITAHLGSQGCRSRVYAPTGPVARGDALAADVELVRYRAFCPFIGPAAQRRAVIANGGNLASFELLWKLWRDPSVAVAHLHTGLRIGGAVRTAMRRRRKPYIMKIHGPLYADAAWMAQETEKRYRGLIDVGQPIGLVLGSRQVVTDAARVISFNDAEHQALQARIGDRAVRFDHGVDVERFSSGDAARALDRWPDLRGRRIVALVGRVCRQKNQELAVRAFSSTAAAAAGDAVLVLAGGQTDPGYADQVRREAQSLGVADRVAWLGNLQPEAVPDILAAAQLVLVPSTQEAFGMAVLEGWGAGRPVLFARRAGLADIARSLDDQTPALDSLEPRDWAAAIDAMLSDADRRQRAVDDGVRVIAARFDWTRHAERLAALYRDVIRESRR